MKTLLLAAIRFYQRWVSPALPGACRFAPSCSEYAIQAISHHGTWKGSILAARRLLRCHPFHPGGYDPVPLGPPETGRRGNGEAETQGAI